MLAFKTLASMLPAFSAAYTLRACTDTSCSEGCQDFSDDDISSDTDCRDFGFTAMSIYWADTLNTLDGWPYEGCAGGTGSENVWITSGNPEDDACTNLESSSEGSTGIQYFIINNSGE